MQLSEREMSEGREFQSRGTLQTNEFWSRGDENEA